MHNKESLLANSLTDHIILSTPTRSTTVEPRQPSIRIKLTMNRAGLSHGHYSLEKIILYWLNKMRNGELPKLGRIVRLLMSVPACAIPQERFLFELKRHGSVYVTGRW